MKECEPSVQCTETFSLPGHKLCVLTYHMSDRGGEKRQLNKSY